MGESGIDAREALGSLVQDFKERLQADEEWGEAGYDFPDSMPRFNKKALESGHVEPSHTSPAPAMKPPAIPTEEPRAQVRVERPAEPEIVSAPPTHHQPPPPPQMAQSAAPERTIEPLPRPSLDQLAEWREKLAETRTWPLDEQNVPWMVGKGNPEASILFIGERVEDSPPEPEKPFSGADGQLLDKMIQAMGYQRETVFLVTLLKTSETNESTVGSATLHEYQQVLSSLVFSVNPKAIVTLGKLATHVLLETDTRLSRLRGRWAHYVHGDVPVMPTYHPAALIRNAHLKRPVWEDLQKVMKQVGP